jgi:hypothetical protein
MIKCLHEVRQTRLALELCLLRVVLVLLLVR